MGKLRSAKSEGSTPFCMLYEYLCHCQRRTMSTSVEASKEAVEFMLKFVAATLSYHDGN